MTLLLILSPFRRKSQWLKMIPTVFLTCLLSVVVECNPAAPAKLTSGASGSEHSSGRSASGGGSSALSSSLPNRLETMVERISSRMETMLYRMDQLDNRLERLQSVVTTRLDGLENSLVSHKLRIDILSEEVSRLDEGLNRKWKSFESKIESQITSFDSKYESRINLMLREGRRYGDTLHGYFGDAEKRIAAMVTRTNASWAELTDLYNQTIVKVLSRNGTSGGGGVSGVPLITAKVTNMFEVLLESSTRVEGLVKESISLGNKTRLELEDNFRLLLGPPPSSAASSFGFSSPVSSSSSGATGRSRGSTSGSSSSSSYRQPHSEVTTAMAILETLASTESMSTTISRRITDLARSIDERFEMVSMTLNGFSDSCQRIQENTPLLEEHIAELLDKIVTAFENRSCGAATLAERVLSKLESMETKCEDVEVPGGVDVPELGPLANASTLISNHGVEEQGPDSGYSEVLRSAARYNATDRDMIMKLFLPRKYWSNSSSSSSDDSHYSDFSTSTSSSSSSSSSSPSSSLLHVPEDAEDDDDNSDPFSTYGD